MTTNNRRALVIAGVLMATSVAPSLQASIARAVSFDQKVREADEIVVGRCVKSYSAFDPSGRWIVTYSTFQVEDALKGNNPREITVMVPGGTVGSIRQDTIGLPRFKEGEEKLIFTAAVGNDKTVLYADQGTYDVLGTGAQRRVAPVSSKLVLIDSKTGTIKNDREPERTLAEFSRSVHNVLQREASGEKTEMSTLAPRHAEPTQQQAKKSLGSRLLEFLNLNRVAVSMLAVGVALSTVALLKRQ